MTEGTMSGLRKNSGHSEETFYFMISGVFSVQIWLKMSTLQDGAKSCNALKKNPISQIFKSFLFVCLFIFLAAGEEKPQE